MAAPSPQCGEETIEARSKPCKTKLYSSWFCPYAQRTWAHMEELLDHGIEYQYVVIDPYQSRTDGLDTKQPLTLAEKAAAYPEFIEAILESQVGLLQFN